MYFDTRVPYGAKDLAQDIFFVPLDFIPIGPAGAGADTLTRSFTADADADLEIVGMSRVITQGVAPAAGDLNVVAFAPLLINLTMTSSGRSLMPSATHIENIAGTAQLPAAWPRPKMVPKASTIKVTLQNLHTANSYNVRLVLYAFKIFY
jgi:hypothetical protein